MKEKSYKGFRKDSTMKLYENDYNYPWDERYTLDFRGIDSIKRCIDVDGVITIGRTGKKY